MNDYWLDKEIEILWYRGCSKYDIRSLEKHINDKIVQALIDEVEIEITYEKWQSGTDTVRLVQPIAIGYCYKKYYLMAYCKLRKDYRTFNLSRIKKITLTDQPLPPFDFYKMYTENHRNGTVFKYDRKKLAAQENSKFRFYVVIAIALALLLFGSCMHYGHKKGIFFKQRVYTEEEQRMRDRIIEEMEEERRDYFDEPSGRVGIYDIRGLQ